MPIPTSPYEEEIIAAWRAAAADLEKQLARIVDDPAWWRRQGRIRQLLAVIDARIDETLGVTESWLARTIPLAYELGALEAAATLDNSWGWSVANRGAVADLAGATFSDFLGRAEQAKRGARATIRKIAGEYTRLAVTTDRTAVGAAREAARALAARGLVVVTYADGSIHSIESWAEMAIRTKTAMAYNSGTLDHVDESGIKWVEVFDGPECGWTYHYDPELALGKIVTVDEARVFPIAHPNCRRTFGGRPDVGSAVDAAKATRSVTPEQTEDQKQSDARNRAAREGRRAAEARRDAIRARRAARGA